MKLTFALPTFPLALTVLLLCVSQSSAVPLSKALLESLGRRQEPPFDSYTGDLIRRTPQGDKPKRLKGIVGTRLWSQAQTSTNNDLNRPFGQQQPKPHVQSPSISSERQLTGLSGPFQVISSPYGAVPPPTKDAKAKYALDPKFQYPPIS